MTVGRTHWPFHWNNDFKSKTFVLTVICVLKAIMLVFLFVIDALSEMHFPPPPVLIKLFESVDTNSGGNEAAAQIFGGCTCTSVAVAPGLL